MLFLSFSRTAASQIVDRATDVLGTYRDRIEINTFHGFAWRILNDFGRYYGQPHPLRVQSSAETRLDPGSPGMNYGQLMPAAQRTLAVPTVGTFYQNRYAMVICDEFQDTDDIEWSFLQSVAPTSPRILLGDINQCIYAGMKKIDPVERIRVALAQPGAHSIELPTRSYRDPTGVLPAAAHAALKREFDDPAIAAAVSGHRLVIHRAATADTVITALDVIRAERQQGKTVSIFTHTHAATTELSSTLTTAEIDHEQVGFTESAGNSLDAQYRLLLWALNRTPGARTALAVYLLSVSSGRGALAQANAIRTRSNPTFESTVRDVIRDLSQHTTPQLNLDGLFEVLNSTHRRLGFPRGEETWKSTNQHLRHAARVLEAGGSTEALAHQVERARVDTLVGFSTSRIKPVQVMNLHQTKGREADATVLLLQEDEYHGREQEPYPTASRLLYVCLTRARERAHIVVPDVVHPLWAALVNRCIEVGNGS